MLNRARSRGRSGLSREFREQLLHRASRSAGRFARSRGSGAHRSIARSHSPGRSDRARERAAQRSRSMSILRVRSDQALAYHAHRSRRALRSRARSDQVRDSMAQRSYQASRSLPDRFAPALGSELQRYRALSRSLVRSERMSDCSELISISISRSAVHLDQALAFAVQRSHRASLSMRGRSV